MWGPVDRSCLNDSKWARERGQPQSSHVPSAFGLLFAILTLPCQMTPVQSSVNSRSSFAWAILSTKSIIHSRGDFTCCVDQTNRSSEKLQLNPLSPSACYHLERSSCRYFIVTAQIAKPPYQTSSLETKKMWGRVDKSCLNKFKWARERGRPQSSNVPVSCSPWLRFVVNWLPILTPMQASVPKRSSFAWAILSTKSIIHRRGDFTCRVERTSRSSEKLQLSPSS